MDRFYVKYSFPVDEHPGATYYYVGRKFTSDKASYDRAQDEAATAIPKKEWDLAQQTGKVEISYSPSNPWANDPSTQRAQYDPTATWMLLVVTFTGFLGLGIFSLYRYFKYRRRI